MEIVAARNALSVRTSPSFAPLFGGDVDGVLSLGAAQLSLSPVVFPSIGFTKEVGSVLLPGMTFPELLD